VDKTQFGLLALAACQEFKKQVEVLTQINEAQTAKINELQAVIVQHNELLAQIVARLPPT
jgi:hypothetical protein